LFFYSSASTPPPRLHRAEIGGVPTVATESQAAAAMVVAAKAVAKAATAKAANMISSATNRKTKA